MKTKLSIAIILLLFLTYCNKNKTAYNIIAETIQAIDTIESIAYKQNMYRTHPQNINDTIYRYREMIFKRLRDDSIVGIKGHWYMFINDKEHVIYEDIYDGNRLIRKNNRDSAALVYDLIKYPEFKKQHFWGHNTIYGMQNEFIYIMNHLDKYTLERLDDAMINGINCYQIKILLEDHNTMPGFAVELEKSPGNISASYFYIEKRNNYPIRMRMESYTKENPKEIIFMDQSYFDIVFNMELDETNLFNTSNESLKGFVTTEIIPNQ